MAIALATLVVPQVTAQTQTTPGAGNAIAAATASRSQIVRYAMDFLEDQAKSIAGRSYSQRRSMRFPVPRLACGTGPGSTKPQSASSCKS